ncbi:MAG: VIT family protein [Myxococcaceae bacterium]
MKFETHRGDRAGWLRAAVLGANDGIVSTASLLVGVAAAQAQVEGMLIAGAAGAVAGALSMAVGEYVSVSAQRDAERADEAKERREQATEPEAELEELVQIYQRRGLQRPLAQQVAEALHEHDALGAHLRDELGINEMTRARPLQAGVVSALSFGVGALAPLLAAAFAPGGARGGWITAVALVLLLGTGALSGVLGGAGPWKAAMRVVVGGALAMGLTALVGHFAGVNLG